jgi:hypothetical protein
VIGGKEALEERGLDPVIMVSLPSYPISIFIIYMCIKKKGRSFKDYLYLHPIRVKTCTFWGAVILVYCIGWDIIKACVGLPVVPEEQIQQYRGLSLATLWWVVVLIGAPLHEEILFRGLLFNGFSRIGKVAGAVAVSFLWTIFHPVEFYELIWLFGAGLILVYARLRSNSLYICIMMHTINNLIAAVETAYIA